MLHRLVSKAADGLDGEFGISVETLPQTVDVCIDGIVVGFRLHSPNLIHELHSGKDFARVG